MSTTVFSYDACIQETSVVGPRISGSIDIEFAVMLMGACIVRAAYLCDLSHFCFLKGPSRLTERCSMAFGGKMQRSNWNVDDHRTWAFHGAIWNAWNRLLIAKFHNNHRDILQKHISLGGVIFCIFSTPGPTGKQSCIKSQSKRETTLSLGPAFFVVVFAIFVCFDSCVV